MVMHKLGAALMGPILGQTVLGQKVGSALVGANVVKPLTMGGLTALSGAGTALLTGAPVLVGVGAGLAAVPVGVGLAYGAMKLRAKMLENQKNKKNDEVLKERVRSVAQHSR